MHVVWHVDASSVVLTVIDIGKLASQIATLLPNVVKRIENQRIFTARYVE